MAIEITYFVHGTTLDNQEHKSTGWDQGELSEKGIQQSKDLVEQIKDKSFDIIFSSDLKRAVDSAKLNFPNKEIICDSRIRECNYGDLNGKSEELVVYSDHISKPFPNGESLHDVQKRVEEFSKELLKKYNNKKIAIVGHKAPQLAFEVVCNNKTWEQAIDTDWRKTKSWQPGWKYILYNISDKFLKGVGKTLDVTGKFIKNTAEAGWNKCVEFKDGISDSISKNNAFKEKTYEFEIKGQDIRIRAFRDDIENNFIFFKQGSRGENLIFSGTVLKNIEDASEIQILMVDRRKVEQREITFNDKVETIPCFKATFKHYEEKEKSSTIQNFINSQTVTVESGATTGDINQINNIEKLNQIEEGLKNFKPSMFQKKNKEDAIKMFGSFKECIVNQKRNETLFQKFIKVLGVITPILVPVVQSLI